MDRIWLLRLPLLLLLAGVLLLVFTPASASVEPRVARLEVRYDPTFRKHVAEGDFRWFVRQRLGPPAYSSNLIVSDEFALEVGRVEVYPPVKLDPNWLTVIYDSHNQVIRVEREK